MGIAIKDAAAARFDGDFEIVLSGDAPGEEKLYASYINAVLKDLSDDDEDDRKRGMPAERLAGRQERRKDAAAKLRDGVTEYRADPLVLANRTADVFKIQGIYIAERNRLDARLFEISLKTSEKNKAIATDLIIELNDGLPGAESTPTDAKRDLFVQIANAQTVIGTVCKQLREADKSSDEIKEADRLLDSYLRKLGGIARLGLEGPFTPLAAVALAELRNEFVAQQAGRIKNAYVRKLGYVAAAAAAVLLVVYVLILIRHNVTKQASTEWWYFHSKFLLAAVGAAAGAWSSFLIRRVQLTFANLAAVEEDLLDPAARIIFVIGLSLAACLLFWTGVMNIEIGSLKTNATEFERNGSIALLIGIFCGLSERALATAISGRAAAFVRGIGGSA